MVVLPAYNEAGYIDAVLPGVMSWVLEDPKTRSAVVANDGSTDRTVEIAKEAGFPVVHSDPKNPRNNLGKSAAIKAGAAYAREKGCYGILTLDSDLKGLGKEHINKLANAFVEGEHDMVIAPTREAGSGVVLNKSGQRAIRLEALKPWFEGDKEWDLMLHGYGFEIGTNDRIPHRTTIGGLFDHVFEAHAPFRKPSARQYAEVGHAAGVRDTRLRGQAEYERRKREESHSSAERFKGLYEILEGRPLFPSETPGERIVKDRQRKLNEELQASARREEANIARLRKALERSQKKESKRK